MSATTPSASPSTSTTAGARAHARAQDGTVVDAQPRVPAATHPSPPPDRTAYSAAATLQGQESVFLVELSAHGMGKRDQVSNVNWFMNVPVDPDGALGIVDGISSPGLSVSLRAERDTLVVVPNCPQINNPCNGFDPSRAELVVHDGRGADAAGGAR